MGSDMYLYALDPWNDWHERLPASRPASHAQSTQHSARGKAATICLTVEIHGARLAGKLRQPLASATFECREVLLDVSRLPLLLTVRPTLLGFSSITQNTTQGITLFQPIRCS